jgi:putative DNA primase/helicase
MNPEQQILVERLREGELSTKRFLKVDENKGAFEKDWPNKLYDVSDLESYPRWGICGKDFLVLIDTDKREMYELLSKVLPETFEVTSPRRGLPHKYFIVCGEQVPNKTFAVPGDYNEKGQLNGAGELRANNEFLVAPGTTINYIDEQTGEKKSGMYTITKNIPIARIEYGDFMAAIQPYVKNPGDSGQKITREEMKAGVGQGFRHAKAMSYAYHLIAVVRTGQAIALQELERFGKSCTPPLTDVEYFKRTIEAAAKLEANVTKKPIEYFLEGTELAVIPKMEEIMNEEKNQSFEYFTKNGFEPVLFANDLLIQYHFKTTIDDETIYVYNPTKGIYTPTGAALIKEEMEQRLGAELRKRYYADVEFKIQAATHFERPKNPPNKLVCYNGVLNVETFELESFTPAEFVTIQIPVSYALDVDCPKIKQFILEVVGKDQTPIIQEMLGYCLLQAYPFHNAIMLVGDGSNGKTTLINLIKRFLGGDNVSNVSLQALCENRFAPFSLYGKLANLFADLPDKSLNQTGMFKMLCGNDTVGAEQKYHDIFSFLNFAKLIFSCNKIPQTSDDTNAFFRRWIIVTCPNVFIGSKRDPHILEKIVNPSEMSGLLNWALEGLKRLTDKGEFSNSKTFEELRSRYIKASNSAQAYIEENLEYTPEHTAKIEERELYETYVKWCNQNNLPTKRKAEFTQQLYQSLPGVKQTSERKDGKIVHAYQFVKDVTPVTTHPSKPYIFNQNGLDKPPVTPVTNCEEEAS